MAVAAYTGRGLLRKNPLLGSSLDIDPARAGVREQYMSVLYPEARQQASKGREGMVRTLSERYKRFGDPHTERLKQIRSELSTLTGEAGTLETEQLEAQKEGTRLKEKATTAASKKKKTFFLDYAGKRKYAKQERAARSEAEALKRAYLERKQRLMDIGAISTPLAEEQTKRERKLTERSDLYNLFLGV